MPTPPSCFLKASTEMSDESVNSLLGVLKFIMTILLPRYPTALLQFFNSIYLAKQRTEKTKLKLELWSVPEDAFMCLIPMNIKPSIARNMDSSILVSFSTLQALGVNSCSWLKLKKIISYFLHEDLNTVMIISRRIPHEVRNVSSKDGTEKGKTRFT